MQKLKRLGIFCCIVVVPFVVTGCSLGIQQHEVALPAYRDAPTSTTTPEIGVLKDQVQKYLGEDTRSDARFQSQDILLQQLQR